MSNNFTSGVLTDFVQLSETAIFPFLKLITDSIGKICIAFVFTLSGSSELHHSWREALDQKVKELFAQMRLYV